MTRIDRRSFLQFSAAAAGAFVLPTSSLLAADAKAPFKISLAQWSLHKALKGGKLDNLDFAKVAKEECGIEAIEYVNQFFAGKAKDEKYLGEMISRSDDLGVKRLLIMIDGEGDLGASDDAKRTAAIEKHYKWVEAAKFMGCHSIRVNARTDKKYEEGMKLAADGLRRLSEFAQPHGINVIVENHGGLSSNGEWLAGVMKTVDLPNCGTLPDFGNFHEYDRYKGVEETMPFAKAVSAKSHDFDAEGNETRTDYFKMMDIVVKKFNYHGYVGVEYEGNKLPEVEGIIATRKLLERCAEKLG